MRIKSFKKDGGACGTRQAWQTTSFKNIVNQKSIEASVRYLKSRQIKGEKGCLIECNILELQDYSNPCANILLDDQKLIFSLRYEMNNLK